MAALASAWCGPMRSARKSVRGGAASGSSRSGDVCMKTTVRPVDTSVHETVSARSMPRRRQRDTARQLISRCTRSAMGRTSKSPYPSPPPRSTRGKRQHLPHAEAEHPGELELAPELDEAAQAEHRIAQVRGEVAGVDGAHARAAQDVDARRAPEDPRQLVEDVPEDADLVRPPRPAPREDHGDAALAVFVRKARHADRGLLTASPGERWRPTAPRRPMRSPERAWSRRARRSSVASERACAGAGRAPCA